MRDGLEDWTLVPKIFIDGEQILGFDSEFGIIPAYFYESDDIYGTWISFEQPNDGFESKSASNTIGGETGVAYAVLCWVETIVNVIVSYLSEIGYSVESREVPAKLFLDAESVYLVEYDCLFPEDE